MNTLYIDCSMGVNAVKLFAALIELLENPEGFVRRFNSIGLSGLSLEREQDTVKGVSGVYLNFRRISEDDDLYADEIDDDGEHVSHHHSRNYRSLDDIKEMIDDLSVSGRVRKRAKNIYDMIAKAYAEANRKNVDELILHRTGSRDTIASIVGVCMLLEDLQCDRIIASPISVGSGYAVTSKGKLPIPVPAIQNILSGIPYQSGTEEGELCTLDGAALIREVADEFSEMPDITIIRSGVGLGQRKFRTGVNCVKAYLGKIVRASANAAVAVLEAVLYNDTPESLAITAERLNSLGKTEAYTVPITSLKGKAGIVLYCVCDNDCADAAAGEILRNTSARRVRRTGSASYELTSVISESSTTIGTVRTVRNEGFGVSEVEPVHEDVAAIARESGISYQSAYNKIISELK